MTCDDACTHVLREIGGESDPDADVRRHLSDCAPCAGYRREAERVWDFSGRAVESCPRRQNILESGRPRHVPSPLAAAAAALVAAASLLAWAPWPAGSGTTARQEPDANAEELLRKDPELRKQVLRTAVQEKERLAEFEKKLAEAEKAFNDTTPLYEAGKVQEASERAEGILSSFPELKLVILDPSTPQFRASTLKLRVREFALIAQLKLLSAQTDIETRGERAAVEIRLMNDLRGVKRQKEELKARGPQPRKEAAVQLGGAEPTLRQETLDKIRSIRITIDMLESSLQDFVSYLREITRLNIVLQRDKESREIKVTIKLQDAVLDGLLDQLYKQAGQSWDVDRFGILFFKPAKK